MRVIPPPSGAGRPYRFRRWFKRLAAVLSGALCLLVLAAPVGAETLIYTQRVTTGTNFNILVGNGTTIGWAHDLPADLLARATRVGLTVGAYDVDYPDCSQDCPTCTLEQCERDRLSVNGQELRFLEGRNNASQTIEMDLNRGVLRAGANTFEVAPDIDPGGVDWVVRITFSEIRLYVADPLPPVPPPVSAPLLQIEKRQGQNTLMPGMSQSYRITVRNNGTAAASGIEVRDTLDRLLSYREDNAGRARHEDQGAFHRWRFAQRLEPGAEISFTLYAEVSKALRGGVAISNTAYARCDQLPEEVASNTVTALSGFVPVGAQGLRVTKRIDRRNARQGKILSYRVEVANTSLGTIFDLSLEDHLPRGFTLVGGSCLRDGRPIADPRGSRRLEWSLGTLEPEGRTTLRYQVVVGSDVGRGRHVNRAVATGVDGGGNRVRGEDEASVSLSLEDVRLPGRIEVKVFRDHDGDGMLGAVDTPLPGIGLLLSGGLRETSDRFGEAEFDPVDPGRRLLALDERTLPPRASLVGSSSRLVNLVEGETAWEEFIVSVPPDLAKLTGRVFRDTNRNGRFDEGEPLIPAFTAVLDDVLRTAGRDGAFVFTRLAAGSHALWVEAQGREHRQALELLPGANSVDVPIPFGDIRIWVEESR